MRALHLFAGAGGSVLAGRLLGWDSAGAVEIDPYCCAVLEQHGERVLARDIVAFDARHLAGNVDVVVGGWPCQDLSVAGKRAGLGGQRSGLFWQMMRVVDECQPSFVFGENVTGLLSSNGGRDFGVVLSALAARGYDARWQVLGARDVGAPHRRDRVWFLAESRRQRGAVANNDGAERERGSVAIKLAAEYADAGSAGDCREIVANGSNYGRDTRWSEPEELSWRGRRAGGGGGEGTVVVNAGHVEYAACIRRGEGSQELPTGILDGASAGMAPAWGGGPQERDGLGSRGVPEREPHATTAPHHGGSVEPNVGGAHHGLANGMDWPASRGAWPAGRGAPQHAWETPRTVTEKVPDRVARLKALGNGWVPQCAAVAWRMLSDA